MIDKDGNVKVMDFGIAKVVGSHLTQSTLLLTPQYASPEQIKGENVDIRSDIYSLGITLYYMLTGRPPYEGDTPYSIFEKQIRKPLPKISDIRRDIPKYIENIIEKATSKNPNNRYRTPYEMMMDLERGKETLTRSSNIRRETYRKTKGTSYNKYRDRSNTSLIVTTVSIIAVITVGLLFFVMGRGGKGGVSNMGYLSITSNPSGAKVYIDNNESYIGITPIDRFEIEEGEHRIRLIKDGYEEYTTNVLIKSREDKNISVTLKHTVITWERTYGGKHDERDFSIQQTKDGGYIVAGATESFGAGGYDFYIIKLDEDGDKVWERTYGGNSEDKAYSIQQTRDGGYIVAGSTGSFGAGANDFYIIKLDKNGNKEWERTYGGKYNDKAYSIQQTKDGGYIVAGETWSFEKGTNDFYILKLDKDGNKVWERTYKGEGYEVAHSIQQTEDGGYIVAGTTSPFGKGVRDDFYIIKLDKNGDKEWERIYGGIGWDIAHSIQQTKDRGYIVAGSTKSFGVGSSDFYIIKLNEDGSKVWEMTYGGEGYDRAYSIQQTKDRGYIVAGATESFGAGGYDFYIIKLDEDGNKEWEKTYGGKGCDEAYSIQQTKDGGYIVAGITSSFGAGGDDFYIIKLDENGNKESE